MEFYKIESPTTKQIFDAIVNKEYVPIEKIVSKAKHEKNEAFHLLFYELSEEDQENEIELLGCYLRTYNDIFNL